MFLHRLGIMKKLSAIVDAILLESGDKLLLEAGSQVNKDSSVPAQSDASALDGSGYYAIVQSGTTYRSSGAQLGAYING